MAKLSKSRLVFTQAYGPRPGKSSVDSSTFHWGGDLGPEVRNTRGIVLQSIIAGRVTHRGDQYGALAVRTTSSATGDLLDLLRRLYGGVIAGASVTFDLWHLEARLLPNGVDVAEGAPVGVMGTTGRSTGIHVHVELRIGGKVVDPMPFVNAQASKAVAPAPADYNEGELTMADIKVITDEQAVQRKQLEAILELLRVPGQAYGYPEHAANQAIAAGKTASIVQKQNEATLALLRVPNQPYGYPQHAASLAAAVLEAVKQQAKLQGVTLDIDAILDEAGKRLSRDADNGS